MSALVPDISDYTGLITSEHRVRPNFLAAATALVQFAVDERAVELSMPSLFDVDVAVGVQLDACGAWVGAPRVIVMVPNAVFPAPPDPYEITLDDDTYRRFIKAVILANFWDGTPEQILPMLETFLGPVMSYAAIVDGQDMSIEILMTGVYPTAVDYAIITQFLIPVRATGVLLNGVWVSPAGPLFGTDVENNFIAGPDVGSFGIFVP